MQRELAARIQTRSGSGIAPTACAIRAGRTQWRTTNDREAVARRPPPSRKRISKRILARLRPANFLRPCLVSRTLTRYRPAAGIARVPRATTTALAEPASGPGRAVRLTVTFPASPAKRVSPALVRTSRLLWTTSVDPLCESRAVPGVSNGPSPTSAVAQPVLRTARDRAPTRPAFSYRAPSGALLHDFGRGAGVVVVACWCVCWSGCAGGDGEYE